MVLDSPTTNPAPSTPMDEPLISFFSVEVMTVYGCTFLPYLMFISPASVFIRIVKGQDDTLRMPPLAVTSLALQCGLWTIYGFGLEVFPAFIANLGGFVLGWMYCLMYPFFCNKNKEICSFESELGANQLKMAGNTVQQSSDNHADLISDTNSNCARSSISEIPTDQLNSASMTESQRSDNIITKPEKDLVSVYKINEAEEFDTESEIMGPDEDDMDTVAFYRQWLNQIRFVVVVHIVAVTAFFILLQNESVVTPENSFSTKLVRILNLNNTKSQSQSNSGLNGVNCQNDGLSNLNGCTSPLSKLQNPSPTTPFFLTDDFAEEDLGLSSSAETLDDHVRAVADVQNVVEPLTPNLAIPPMLGAFSPPSNTNSNTGTPKQSPVTYGVKMNASHSGVLNLSTESTAIQASQTISLPSTLTLHSYLQFLGWVAFVFNIVMYAAPIIFIIDVLNTGAVEKMGSWQMNLVALCNSACYALYSGYFMAETKEVNGIRPARGSIAGIVWQMFIPNMLGVLFGSIAIYARVKFWLNPVNRGNNAEEESESDFSETDHDIMVNNSRKNSKYGMASGRSSWRDAIMSEKGHRRLSQFGNTSSWIGNGSYYGSFNYGDLQHKEKRKSHRQVV